MDFELLTIPGCPNGADARDLYSRALALEGLDPARLSVRDIVTEADAASSDFHGSPSFILDGADLFPGTGEPAISCRVYGSAGGVTGLPELLALRRAIRDAMARHPFRRGRFEMGRDEFEDAVDDAIARIPEDLTKAINNVAIMVEERYVPGPGDDPNLVLLGLYVGIPLTKRGYWWDAGSLPDRITIYRQPILDICSSREQVIHQITVTVVHEIAHYFGIGDARLHELGWG